MTSSKQGVDEDGAFRMVTLSAPLSESNRTIPQTELTDFVMRRKREIKKVEHNVEMLVTLRMMMNLI